MNRRRVIRQEAGSLEVGLNRSRVTMKASNTILDEDVGVEAGDVLCHRDSMGWLAYFTLINLLCIRFFFKIVYRN